jgi:hypothetical protein
MTIKKLREKRTRPGHFFADMLRMPPTVCNLLSNDTLASLSGGDGILSAGVEAVKTEWRISLLDEDSVRISG